MLYAMLLNSVFVWLEDKVNFHQMKVETAAKRKSLK